MFYSPESLDAFVQSVTSGSFSGAARALGKSQSTVSVAVSSLEDHLGFALFERTSRQLILTEEGRRVLAEARDILAANRRLDDVALRLSQGIEPRVTLAISDHWPASHHDRLLHQFVQKYPDVEFECLIAEDEDILELLKTGRAQVGVTTQQSYKQGELISRQLAISSQTGIYLAKNHPLSLRTTLTFDDLKAIRQLQLNTWSRAGIQRSEGKVWSSSSYLLLLDMAQQGFGWAKIPCWMVDHFGDGSLTRLPLAGWPEKKNLEIIWSARHALGPACLWMIEALTVAND
ncbi:LysR family transcriptional regulator [Rosenbergiella australiborealis]|uniref:LysR family transcriptional regulator n=1 Tax=Rosenbergiella australiborealis TaxID=1544696 RepID=A0ABS5TAM4_9GAMM|nr:LysR family transcriptional regulator [Rosenbergiella australiborealis]MBT0728477.1 LysR family transcriptional regulator [Rosenbergiella australiborealis]